jgi:gamma-glutamyltranspeptidase/glutathione hydrolase
VKPAVLQALRDKGHNLTVRGDYTSAMGRGQVVLHNSRTGMNFGASDPRADGVAEPEPLPEKP